ncbi:hypothetical protein PM082_004956 [Marasmius tenuissimus]|nr:hypothetical protein PM082_004956 [Marasmius tenuissimus]
MNIASTKSVGMEAATGHRREPSTGTFYSTHPVDVSAPSHQTYATPGLNDMYRSLLQGGVCVPKVSEVPRMGDLKTSSISPRDFQDAPNRCTWMSAMQSDRCLTHPWVATAPDSVDSYDNSNEEPPLLSLPQPMNAGWAETASYWAEDQLHAGVSTPEIFYDCRQVGSRALTDASIARRKTRPPRYFCEYPGCFSRGFTTKNNYDCESRCEGAVEDSTFTYGRAFLQITCEHIRAKNPLNALDVDMRFAREAISSDTAEARAERNFASVPARRSQEKFF